MNDRYAIYANPRSQPRFSVDILTREMHARPYLLAFTLQPRYPVGFPPYVSLSVPVNNYKFILNRALWVKKGVISSEIAGSGQ